MKWFSGIDLRTTPMGEIGWVWVVLALLVIALVRISWNFYHE